MTQRPTSTSRKGSGASAKAVSATDPESAAEAGARAARRRVPTRGSLREFIKAVLISDSDLDVFCGDHYEHKVYRRFTNGMDRVQKVTLLLDHADHADILEELRQDHPDAARKHEPLLRYWPPVIERPVQRAVAAVAAVVALASWIGPRALVPDVAPFEHDAPGIVLGGSWMSSDGGKKLCEELKALDPQRAVQCLSFPLWGSAAEALRDKAREAGAAVVATVTESDHAVAKPLHPTESSQLLGDGLEIDIRDDSTRKKAALLMHALMLLSRPRPELTADLIPCPEMGTDELDRNALLTLFVVPACEAVKLDPRQYGGVCKESASDADETCALARYLEAEAFPEADRSRRHLEKLRDRGPKRFQDVAKLMLAHADCKAGKAEDAERALLDLMKGASGCDEVKLVETAACVVAARRPASAALQRLEALPVASDDTYGACSTVMRAQALAGRGHWRALAKRWGEASVDYGEARKLHGAPLYSLAQAEMLLHQGSTPDAMKVLQGIPTDVIRCDRSLRAYAALLRWAASQQQNDASNRQIADQAICDLYDGLSSEKPVLEGPTDTTLRALVCEQGRPLCIYDILQQPSSRNKLRQSLRCD